MQILHFKHLIPALVNRHAVSFLMSDFRSFWSSEGCNNTSSVHLLLYFLATRKRAYEISLRGISSACSDQLARDHEHEHERTQERRLSEPCLNTQPRAGPSRPQSSLPSRLGAGHGLFRA